MLINLESAQQYSVKSYSSQQVTIGDITVTSNFFVSTHGLEVDWPCTHCNELNAQNCQDLIRTHKPDVIIIGQDNYDFSFLPIRDYAHKLGIGLEIMSIGAACRTYTILLSEERSVALGVIFS